MPKISAATVAEHRATQLRALLDAAHALLTESPERPPSLGEVAARAGLARSSVYHYFRSREDLLRAVVEDMFPRWNAKVIAAMDEAGDPAGRVLAYVDANLRLVAEGEHALVGALATVTPQAFTDERMQTLHRELVLPSSRPCVSTGPRIRNWPPNWSAPWSTRAPSSSNPAGTWRRSAGRSAICSSSSTFHVKRAEIFRMPLLTIDCQIDSILS